MRYRERGKEEVQRGRYREADLEREVQRGR